MPCNVLPDLQPNISMYLQKMPFCVLLLRLRPAAAPLFCVCKFETEKAVRVLLYPCACSLPEIQLYNKKNGLKTRFWIVGKEMSAAVRKMDSRVFWFASCSVPRIIKGDAVTPSPFLSS